MKPRIMCLLTLCFVLSTANWISAQRVETPQDVNRDIFAFVPADTPFVMGVTAAVPEVTMRRFQRNLEPIFEIYRELLNKEVEKASLGDEERSRTQQLIDKLNWQGLASLGFDLRGRSVLYGVDLIPVFRLELTDPQRLHDVILEFEELAGGESHIEVVDGQEYWRFSSPGRGSVLLAIQGRHLVLAFQPKSASEESLGKALGVAMPDASLADSGKLDAIAAKHGFLPFMIGFADLLRVADRAFESAGTYDESCRSETLSILEKTPQLVFGLTELNDERISQEAILELSPDLRNELAALVNSVPGVGRPSDGLMSFGLSLNLPGLLDFVSRRAAVIKADPFRCEWFTAFNKQFDQVEKTLESQLTVGGPFSGLRGLNLVLKSLELEQGQPRNLQAYMILHADGPAAILDLARASLPPLGDLTVERDGEPVPLPQGLLPPPWPESFVALTDDALGLAMGLGMVNDLRAAFLAETLQPTPFVAVSYKISIYRRLLGQTLDKGGESPEALEMYSRLMSMYDFMESTWIRLSLTDSGLSYSQGVVLKK